ncbi:MAG: LacI family DNA-binding transcriptional regulator [Okeania sp. SIO3C4]|nr:LacI family DNA-binding transcriptional regulator [Okeania sp. SIO3C4]
MGYIRKKKLAELAGVSITTISKFFNQKPIRVDKFNIICKTLLFLDYEAIIQKVEEE